MLKGYEGHIGHRLDFLWAAFEIPTDEAQVMASLLAYFTKDGPRKTSLLTKAPQNK